jgi:glutamate synthase domain-containing protein 3
MATIDEKKAALKVIEEYIGATNSEAINQLVAKLESETATTRTIEPKETR